MFCKRLFFLQYESYGKVNFTSVRFQIIIASTNFKKEKKFSYHKLVWLKLSASVMLSVTLAHLWLFESLTVALCKRNDAIFRSALTTRCN